MMNLVTRYPRISTLHNHRMSTLARKRRKTMLKTNSSRTMKRLVLKWWTSPIKVIPVYRNNKQGLQLCGKISSPSIRRNPKTTHMTSLTTSATSRTALLSHPWQAKAEWTHLWTSLVTSKRCRWLKLDSMCRWRRIWTLTFCLKMCWLMFRTTFVQLVWRKSYFSLGRCFSCWQGLAYKVQSASASFLWSDYSRLSLACISIGTCLRHLT